MSYSTFLRSGSRDQRSRGTRDPTLSPMVGARVPRARRVWMHTPRSGGATSVRPSADTGTSSSPASIFSSRRMCASARDHSSRPRSGWRSRSSTLPLSLARTGRTNATCGTAAPERGIYSPASRTSIASGHPRSTSRMSM